MLIDDLLILLTLILLTTALPLSIIAALGFRKTPFGKVVTPIPVIVAAYIVVMSSRLIDYSFPETFPVAFSTIAVLSAVWAAIQGAMLLSERRDL